ncbi:MAG: OmpA family protein [Acetobacteraceae bacterium]|nr:OmpA family protein [Acetobacteraceae bacterium]
MSGFMDRRSFLAAGLASLAGCAQQQAGTAPAAPAAPAPPYSSADTAGPPVAFDRAVQIAADRVLATTPKGAARQTVIIDPLVDGVTGEQSAATQQIQNRILEVARANYPQFEFPPFSAEVVARNPLVMVGTFTPVSVGAPGGAKDAFRFCLAMGDLQSGRAVAKAVTRAQFEGVDTTPTPFFRDSPAWTDDALVKSYVTTCQGTKVGDPIPPAYLRGILTASMISDAISAYAAGRYAEALDLYHSAERTQAGDQLRVHNGLYLCNWKLGHRAEAERAFGDLVDYSLNNNRLAVKLLFRPGSTGLVGQENGPTEMWLRQIATRAAARNTCLQVSGHTSRTGSAALNEQLSLLRAEYVKSRLEEDAPALRGRVIAAGFGSSQNLVGTGADNATDALDRRVEFKVMNACT